MNDGYLFNTAGYIDDLKLRVWPITSSLFDKWNNAWIGTWGLGPMRGNLASLRLDLLPQGLFDMDGFRHRHVQAGNEVVQRRVFR